MRRRPLLACALVACVAVPLCMHAHSERRAQIVELARLREMTERLARMAPIARHAGTTMGSRVYINGQPTFFGVTTATSDVKTTLDRVGGECSRGDLGVRLAPRPHRDDDKEQGFPSSQTALTLTRIEREERQTEGGASLCVFRASDASEGASEASRIRIRYTLVHRIDDTSTSVFTIATECESPPLDVLFPIEGDAPGGDIAGVPRPRGSRRTFAANIEGDPYAVRIYEVAASSTATATPLTTTLEQYDADMIAAGWMRHASVANALPTSVRSYSLGRVELVASFEQAEDGTTLVSIAPLESS